jgi:hypothetical protein
MSGLVNRDTLNYAKRWTIRLDTSGALEGIRQYERCDPDILKITPAPIDMLRDPRLAPQSFTNFVPKTDGIFIIRPEDVPQSPYRA